MLVTNLRYSEWEHFGTNVPCPYHFSAEELQLHDREAGSFKKSQEFWKGLQEILTDEGYASSESFASAVEILKKLRELGLGNLRGEELRNFDRATRWVLDLGGHNS
jgi:hypothetical protein